MRFLSASFAVLVTAGCADQPIPVLASGPPNYAEDVTPILARACWCCHQSDGIASNLESYAVVTAGIDEILGSIASGEMPPGAGNATTGCVPVASPIATPTLDLAVLTAWRDAGTPRGLPERDTPLPPRCGRLDAPETLRLDNGGYAPAASTRVECFVLDGSPSEDTHVVGAHFEPGSAAVRSIALQLTPPPYEPGEAFDCPLGLGSLVSPEPLAYWQPGSGDMILPAGSGIPLAAGSSLTMRVQYQSAEPGLPIVTGVELGLSASVRRPGRFALATDQALTIEPGNAGAERVSAASFTVPVRVESVALVMYDHGRAGRVELVRSDDVTCLLDVPEWDVLGTRIFHLETPLDGRDAILRARCTFDTTGSVTAVAWGDPPDGDVCIAAAYVTL